MQTILHVKNTEYEVSTTNKAEHAVMQTGQQTQRLSKLVIIVERKNVCISLIHAAKLIDTYLHKEPLLYGC